MDASRRRVRVVLRADVADGGVSGDATRRDGRLDFFSANETNERRTSEGPPRVRLRLLACAYEGEYILTTNDTSLCNDERLFIC